MSFLSHLNWRYATQKFNEVIIPPEELIKILDAIRLAPSSFGLQPYHVSIITDQDLKQKIKAKAWNQEQVSSCSHLFIFSARTDIDDRIETYFNMLSGGDEQNRLSTTSYEESMRASFKEIKGEGLERWASQQTYLALGFALAACAELQIDACPIEGFDMAGVRDILQLPVSMHPVVLLTMGYRDPDDVLRVKLRFDNDDLFNLN